MYIAALSPAANTSMVTTLLIKISFLLTCMPYPEEDVIDPIIIDGDNIRLLCCQQAVVLKQSQSQLPYNSQESVNEEEDEVEGDHEEDGELSLHQLA